MSPRDFTTAADQELCRCIALRVARRYTTALGAIIALHRSERDIDGTFCRLCQEDWPCRTIGLALTGYQQAQAAA